MSRNNRVIWSEGMFLRPQHYQQYTRYWESYIDGRVGSVSPFPWGFLQVNLDAKLLDLGKIAVEHASGVFQDGTPFIMPGEEPPPQAIEIADTVKNSIVYLCLPLRRAGVAELDHEEGPESLARYSSSEAEVEDDSTVGGGSATIQLGALKARLKLESEPLDDYAGLAIGRIAEVRADGSIMMDESFIPPVLAVQASPLLAGFLNELQGLLDHRAQALAARLTVSDRGGAAEIQDFLLLQTVNRYLPLVSHFVQARQLHPENLYQQLIMLAGELATFMKAEKRAEKLPEYRHGRLQETFEPVIAQLRQSLSMVIEQNAVSIPLQERKFGIRVAVLADKSLLDSASFVLAIAADVPTEDIRQHLPRQITIGATEQIRQLVNVQMPGIRIRPMPAAPRQVPYHSGFVYFELERGGELWDQLKSSGGMAIHLSGDFPGLKMELWAIRG